MTFFRYPISLEFLKEIWIPNVFIYNLKTFQNVAVLKKLAGEVMELNYHIIKTSVQVFGSLGAQMCFTTSLPP